MSTQEPVARLSLRTLRTNLRDDGVLVLDDGETVVELVPCTGGPEVAEALDALIHQAGYAWELTTRRLRRELDQVAGEQG